METLTLRENKTENTQEVLMKLDDYQTEILYSLEGIHKPIESEILLDPKDPCRMFIGFYIKTVLKFIGNMEVKPEDSALKGNIQILLDYWEHYFLEKPIIDAWLENKGIKQNTQNNHGAKTSNFVASLLQGSGIHPEVLPLVKNIPGDANPEETQKIYGVASAICKVTDYLKNHVN